MTFTFPDLGDIPQQRRPDRPESAPEPIQPNAELGVFPNELGVPVALPGLLVVTDHVAVSLDTFFVHRSGMHAMLRTAHRDPMTNAGPQRRSTFSLHPRYGLEPDTELWRLALEFADGRSAATPSQTNKPWTDDFILSIYGGGGDSVTQIHRVYVSPVPPAGPVTMHLDLGSDGTHSVTVEATALRTATERALLLWPLAPGG